MKKITLALFLLTFIGSSALFAQKSPRKNVEGKIGETNIVIDYGSPSVRGREVYGGLEKFGKVWRAGANEATTIDFSKDVTINGKMVKAGKYAFFVIPMEGEEWPIILNSESNQWGAYKLDEAKNVLKTMAKTSKIENQEELTYVIKDGMIHLDWSTTRLSFKID